MTSSQEGDIVAKQLFPTTNNELTPENLQRRAIRSKKEGPGLVAVGCFLMLVLVAGVATPVVIAGGLLSHDWSFDGKTKRYNSQC